MKQVERGLRYFPIGLFASVMGFAGVTIATKQAETMFDWNHILSTIFLVITILLFVVNITLFFYRLIRFYDDVKSDFNHPIKMNFFATISISLLLLAVTFLELNNTLSFVLWIIGAIVQITFTLVILSKLIWKTSYKIEQFNPTWFIPIVGNIVVPVAGSAHVSLDINYFFYGVGIVFSIIYLAIFFFRAFFFDVLSPPLLPSYFILMAPPAIGFVSYINLTGTVDVFASILYGFAFFIGLLLLFQFKRFIRIPFFVTWWAYLFPSAAMTIATGQMYLSSGNVIYQWLFILQEMGLIVLVIYLFIKTSQLLLKGKLFLKEG